MIDFAKGESSVARPAYEMSRTSDVDLSQSFVQSLPDVPTPPALAIGRVPPQSTSLLDSQKRSVQWPPAFSMPDGPVSPLPTPPQLPLTSVGNEDHEPDRNPLYVLLSTSSVPSIRAAWDEATLILVPPRATLPVGLDKWGWDDDDHNDDDGNDQKVAAWQAFVAMHALAPLPGAADGTYVGPSTSIRQDVSASTSTIEPSIMVILDLHRGKFDHCPAFHQRTTRFPIANDHTDAIKCGIRSSFEYPVIQLA